MSFSLGDALAQYRSVVDTTHRFWGYFQIAAAAAAGFAWTNKGPHLQPWVYSLLAVAFVIFTIINAWLVATYQRSAVLAAQDIKHYVAENPAEVPLELRPLIMRLKPDPVTRVVAWHAALSGAVVISILLAR